MGNRVSSKGYNILEFQSQNSIHLLHQRCMGEHQVDLQYPLMSSLGIAHGKGYVRGQYEQSGLAEHDKKTCYSVTIKNWDCNICVATMKYIIGKRRTKKTLSPIEYG